MASRRHLFQRGQRSTRFVVSFSRECADLWEQELSRVQTVGQSQRYWGFTLTSRKNTNVRIQANAEKVAETAQGRKYGYFLRNSEFPKVSGKRSVGRDNDPPIVGLECGWYWRPMQRATHLPERPAEVPRNWHVRVHLRNVCRVGDLCNNTFNDANVAVEGSIESPAGLNYGVNRELVVLGIDTYQKAAPQ